MTALPLVSAGAVNYSGICLWEMRRVSSDELCERLFKGLNRASAYRLMRTGERQEIVAYESIVQYRSLYPNWCRVASPGYAFGRPTFFDRVTGRIAHVIRFDFFARWRRMDGSVETDAVSNKAPYYATACGSLWDLN